MTTNKINFATHTMQILTALRNLNSTKRKRQVEVHYVNVLMSFVLHGHINYFFFWDHIIILAI
jgi:hypothetical protein